MTSVDEPENLLFDKNIGLNTIVDQFEHFGPEPIGKQLTTMQLFYVHENQIYKEITFEFQLLRCQDVYRVWREESLFKPIEGSSNSSYIELDLGSNTEISILDQTDLLIKTYPSG